jgi:hypothetical protein
MSLSGSLSGIIKQFADTLKQRERQSGYTDTFTAYLGDNKGNITAPLVSPGRQVWYYVGDSPGDPRYVGTATLTTNDIYWGEDTADRQQRDLAIVVGRAPASLHVEGYCVFGVSGSLGRVAQGNQTQTEKEIVIAQTPQLTVAATDGTNINNVSLMVFPSGWVTANTSQANEALITPPSGGGGGGGSTPPSTLSPVKYHNATDQSTVITNPASTQQYLAFDTKDLDGLPTCDFTPGYWEFVAPATGYYTFTTDIYLGSNMDSTQQVFLSLNPVGHDALTYYQANMAFGTGGQIHLGGSRTVSLAAGTAICVLVTGPRYKLDGTTAVTLSCKTGSKIQVDWNDKAGSALLPVRVITYVSGTSSYKIATGQSGQTLVSVTAQVSAAFNSGAYASIGTLADNTAAVDFIDLTDAHVYFSPVLVDASSDIYLFFNSTTSLNSVKVALLLGV